MQTLPLRVLQRRLWGLCGGFLDVPLERHPRLVPSGLDALYGIQRSTSLINLLSYFNGSLSGAGTAPSGGATTATGKRGKYIICLKRVLDPDGPSCQAGPVTRREGPPGTLGRDVRCRTLDLVVRPRYSAIGSQTR